MLIFINITKRDLKNGASILFTRTVHHGMAQETRFPRTGSYKKDNGIFCPAFNYAGEVDLTIARILETKKRMG